MCVTLHLWMVTLDRHWHHLHTTTGLKSALFSSETTILKSTEDLHQNLQ